MAINYAIYPFKNLRITQTYNGSTSHKPHTTGRPKDYPIDEGGKDTGKEACYCPCDRIKVVRVYGVNARGTNTVFWESTAKVKFADGTTDYLCGMFTHTVDSDLKNIKAGTIFKRGEVVCKEGTDGNVGMHLHMSFGKGKLTNGGWVENSNGKWVLSCTGGTFKPEELLYIDEDFSKIYSTAGLVFKKLPKYVTGTYKVSGVKSYLNVRTGAGTNYATKTFNQLTANAQAQVKKLNGGKAVNGLVNGCECTVSKVDGKWGKIPSGWICLDYCTKIK